MGSLAQRMMQQSADVLASRNTDSAMRLEREDDRMDELHRELFRHLLDDRWKHGVAAAVDVTLADRYYERYADQAVSAGRRVLYLVTGEPTSECRQYRTNTRCDPVKGRP